MPAGVCRVCGCTDERACPGGCAWITGSGQTLCTACKLKDYERQMYGQQWCFACNRPGPIVMMVYANPTIESAREALCALLEPMPLCRGCVRRAQYMMLEGRPAGWRMRDPVEAR